MSSSAPDAPPRSLGQLPSRDVVLVDDHQIVRDGLKALIMRLPGWNVSGEAGEGLEGVETVLRLRPETVITDMMMPGATGLELARRLRHAGYAGRIILLSAHASEALRSDARAAGIDAVLSKDCTPAELAHSLDDEASGSGHISGEHSRPPRQPGTEGIGVAALERLTERERQILIRIANGLQSKEIASELGISPRTVDVHRHHLQRKLGASGLAELTRLAVRAGLVHL